MFSLADELVGERLATRLTLLAPRCTMSAHHILYSEQAPFSFERHSARSVLRVMPTSSLS